MRKRNSEYILLKNCKNRELRIEYIQSSVDLSLKSTKSTIKIIEYSLFEIIFDLLIFVFIIKIVSYYLTIHFCVLCYFCCYEL